MRTKRQPPQTEQASHASRPVSAKDQVQSDYQRMTVAPNALEVLHAGLPARASLTTRRAASILQMQRSQGNRAVQRLVGSVPAPLVQRETDPAEVARVAKLKADYNAAVQAEDWPRAAVLLNGFNDEDILVRLQDLSAADLRLMDAAAVQTMPGWSDRVHRPIVQLLLASGGPASSSQAPRGASRGSFAPPTEQEMAAKPASSRKKWQEWLDTRDAKAQSFGAADYEDYVRKMLVSGGAVFGRTVAEATPVHPLFLDRLEAASSKAKAAIGAGDFGVNGFGGQQNRPGNHAWGLAIDIDAAANPYVINERGEQTLDALIEPIYERIAQALLHRPSVLTGSVAATGPKDKGAPTRLAGADYGTVAEESDAMVAYFSVLPAPEAPAVSTPESGKTPAAKPLPAPRKLTGWNVDPADLARLDPAQVRADYDLLTGTQAVELVDGVPTPAPIDQAWRKKTGVTGDFPFAGAGAGRERDPKRGFLTIREEVVAALRGEKLRWGAIDFAAECGDIMHFDDGNRHADYVKYGEQHPTEKRRKQIEDQG